MKEEKFDLKRIGDREFVQLKENYKMEQDSYTESFIFHVGVGAGFYSELGGLMEAMMYCHYRKIKFILYADDANFSREGWNDFFDSFCEESHFFLNKYANTRKFVGSRKKIWLQEKLNRVLKTLTGARYTTQDFFFTFIGKEFKDTYIEWRTMSIDGTVRKEYAKLKNLAMRYNRETWNEMKKLVKLLNMPQNYISVHVRGGDKIQEVGELLDADYCVRRIEEIIENIKNVFVFTDDYRNVEIFKKQKNWNVYTLTEKEEKGYHNTDFNKQDWMFKRRNLIKLFTMVEICIGSKTHFGDAHSCVNNVIYSCKDKGTYIAL